MKQTKEQKRLAQLYRATGLLYAEAQKLANHIASVQSEVWTLMRDRNLSKVKGEQLEIETGEE